MFVRLARWLVALALIFAVGAHWTLLQSVAWMGMALSYSRTAPLTQAIGMTFDGKHPCRVCKFVAGGRKSEKQQQDSRKSSLRLDFLLCPDAEAMIPPAREPIVRTNVSPCPPDRSPPRPPPPRVLSA